MEIHHKGHHQTYVNNLNQALEQISEAKTSNNEIAAASLASALNFNGGGHTNHTLFWENLAPANKGGGGWDDGHVEGHLPAASGGGGQGSECRGVEGRVRALDIELGDARVLVAAALGLTLRRQPHVPRSGVGEERPLRRRVVQVRPERHLRPRLAVRT